MKNNTKIHEKEYLKCREQLKQIDLVSRASVLGAGIRVSGLLINFFGETFVVDRDGVKKENTSPVNMAVAAVICRYVIMAPGSLPDEGEWITYREFKGSGPLSGFFNDNTKKNIETAFAGNAAGLKEACEKLMGKPVPGEHSFDVSIEIPALPRIPLLVRFNDRDEDFPVQASLFFRESAQRYLDLESLTILGTYLTGKLLRGENGSDVNG